MLGMTVLIINSMAIVCCEPDLVGRMTSYPSWSHVTWVPLRLRCLLCVLGALSRDIRGVDNHKIKKKKPNGFPFLI